VPSLTSDQMDDAVLNGLRGLMLLKDPSARSLGEKLAASDPSLRVRRDILAILQGKGKDAVRTP
jgi:hypothetical protein